MRYEILFNEGGIALDADSLCLRPLEDWLLEPAAFAAWRTGRIKYIININILINSRITRDLFE